MGYGLHLDRMSPGGQYVSLDVEVVNQRLLETNLFQLENKHSESDFFFF